VAGRVVVVGSLNVDTTLLVDRLPAPGQTVVAGGLVRALGGKGFNQAVTAARQGAAVTMVGAVGDDEGGRSLLAALAAEGVDAGAVSVVPGAETGMALITVDADGTNTIAVSPGANGLVPVPAPARFAGAAVVLTQLEVPLAVAAAAMAAGALTILNPSPALALLDADVIVMNETEAAALGPATAPTVIVTRGERGATVNGRPVPATAPPGPVVDTTGAGDAFCGALAAALAAGRPLDQALARASAAGAHAVTVHGALPSLSTAADVDRLLARRG
jgi:ribokinase